jgi:nucleotide-binding universal stress UspA family protein
MREDAEAYLRSVAPPGAHVLVAVEPGVARGIIKAAEAWQADAIAIATHGHGGFRRLLLGSVADKVIRASPLPVCVVRPESGED